MIASSVLASSATGPELQELVLDGVSVSPGEDGLEGGALAPLWELELQAQWDARVGLCGGDPEAELRLMRGLLELSRAG
ncbi:hypothetical protein GPECTOR_58g565 [Gonium pectorale]|uniref:Uncharacterized protein n=1 Tax=Gonium pectorale TaxID=33097 RepID=A0A150G5F5_GONPE|nr:hypothetical protein GPECTOR_58g565 [Gonium pectorale]|eukprot:KXZ45116.1 hypothetical protein GPECTOR_58g565 [Gonium pectorale]